MRQVIKWLLVTFAFLLAVVMSVFIGTRGDYPVARIVTDDPSLPS